MFLGKCVIDLMEDLHMAWLIKKYTVTLASIF